MLETKHTLDISVENNQILIAGQLGGHPVKVLFDSAFPASIIPVNAAQTLGVNIDYFATHNKSEWYSPDGTAYLTDLVVDGQGVSRSFFGIFSKHDNFGAPDVVTLLGNDFWSNYDVEIDLDQKSIKLYAPHDCAKVNLAYWDKTPFSVSMGHVAGLTTFQAELNGRPIVAVLDSGSPYSSITEQTAAHVGVRRDGPVIDQYVEGRQLPDLPSLIAISHSIAADINGAANIRPTAILDLSNISRRSSYWVGKAESLTLDDDRISTFPLRVFPISGKMDPQAGARIPRRADRGFDMLLGVDFLLTHHVMISNSQQRIYFTEATNKAQ